jgi:hypothetical protein
VLYALLATIVLETLIASAILRRFVWWQGLVIQLLTWPLAQYLVWHGARLWLIELGVLVVEAILWRLLLRTVSWPRAIVLSLLTNGVTAAIAFAIR